MRHCHYHQRSSNHILITNLLRSLIIGCSSRGVIKFSAIFWMGELLSLSRQAQRNKTRPLSDQAEEVRALEYHRSNGIIMQPQSAADNNKRPPVHATKMRHNCLPISCHRETKGQLIWRWATVPYRVMEWGGWLNKQPACSRWWDWCWLYHWRQDTIQAGHCLRVAILS